MRSLPVGRTLHARISTKDNGNYRRYQDITSVAGPEATQGRAHRRRRDGREHHRLRPSRRGTGLFPTRKHHNDHKYRSANRSGCHHDRPGHGVGSWGITGPRRPAARPRHTDVAATSGPDHHSRSTARRTSSCTDAPVPTRAAARSPGTRPDHGGHGPLTGAVPTTIHRMDGGAAARRSLSQRRIFPTISLVRMLWTM